MMRTTMFLLAISFAILPGCASGPAFTDEQLEFMIKRLENETSPPSRWTCYKDVYVTIMAAIALEEQPDFTGIDSDRIDAAYRAIFEDPANPSSRAWFGWIGWFADMTLYATKGWVAVLPGRPDDPLFKKYEGREWKVAHTFLVIRRRFENGTEKVSGIVLSAPEPRLDEAKSNPYTPRVIDSPVFH